MSFYKNEQERCCEVLRSQNDQTAFENLLKKTLPAHHQQKLKKKCFFHFQIFYFFLPCRLSHLTYHFFLAFFFGSQFWCDFYFWADLGDCPTSCSSKNCFAFSKLFFLDFPENSQAMFSQLLSFFLPPSMLFQGESSLWGQNKHAHQWKADWKPFWMSEYFEQNPRAAEDPWLQSWPSQNQKRPTFSLQSLNFWTRKLGEMRGFRLWILS
jgi:hypothetical protein